MSVAGISAVSALADPQLSKRQESDFQKAGQNLQTQEMENAQRAANGLDSVSFSGMGRGQQLITDVSTLTRHLQQGDLAAARTAYQAVRRDVQHSARPAVGSNIAALPPDTVTPGATKAQKGDTGKADGGTRDAAPPTSTSARQSINISA